MLSGVANAQQHVRGHYRDNGRYVQPHYRSSADSSYNNNYSVRPNVNPYTGERGSLSPTMNDRAPSRSSFSNPYGNSFNSSRSLYGR